jgi:DNA modification methylase
LEGDALTVLRTMPDESVQCCVTSPPYYGLRDYGMPGQIGAEDTADGYVTRLVEVFRAVRRVLRDDGILWLNLGDSMRDKQLLMVPVRAALALQADGWFLRSDCIWHKPSAIPEPVKDRPTAAHEHVFLLTKRERYYYNPDAVAEGASSFGRQHTSKVQGPKVRALQESGHHGTGGNLSINYERETRNLRNVWTIASEPYSGSHFATMPPALAERCILAGSKPGDLVLDPFGGAGTTGLVADRLQRNALLIELNPEYAEMARKRIASDAGMFGAVA